MPLRITKSDDNDNGSDSENPHVWSSMTEAQFNAFMGMVDRLPPEEIVGALRRKCRAMHEYLPHCHPSVETLSLFCFQKYIDAINAGISVECAKALPVDHIFFYKRTIDRLVTAKLVANSALEYFDYAFPVGNPKFRPWRQIKRFFRRRWRKIRRLAGYESPR